VTDLAIKGDTYITYKEYQQHLNIMRKTPYLIIDTEGTLTHPHSETWGFSYYCTEFQTAEYFAFHHRHGRNLPREWRDEAKDVIENHPCIVMHNAKHDLRALQNLDIHFTGHFYCTQQMAHFINENLMSKQLNWLSRHFGGSPKNMPPEVQKLIDAFGWPMVPAEVMRSYATNDAIITGELLLKLLPQFQEQGFERSPFGDFPSPWETEQKFIRLFAKLENRGVCIDEETSRQELEKGLQIMEEKKKLLGFNPGSPKQLSKFLTEDLKLPVIYIYDKKTKKNKPTTNKDAMKVYDELLSKNNDHRARDVLIYRGWAKTTSSNYKPYLDRLSPVDRRLRCSYKLHGTHTGRLSCEEPNLQQIPKMSSNDWNGKLKTCITAPPGYTAWEADYAQLEFRLGAAYGKDTKLLEIFNDPTRDIFEELAFEMGMSRDGTKTLIYTMQYGGGIPRISTVFGISTTAAEARRNQFFSLAPGIKRKTDEAARKCREARVLTYWSGRKRHFDNPREQSHKAFNSAIQGGAFEIVKHAMIRLDEAGLNNDDCYMDLQVHDSVRFCIKNGMEDYYLPKIKAIMEDVKPNFGVHFKVEIKKWGTKEVWDLAGYKSN